MQQRHWHANYGGIPTEIDPDRHPSVLAAAEEAMRRHANKIAFVSAGQALSYADIDALSRDFCAYLQYMGVSKGERVAVMLPNIAAFPVVTFGIARAGAVQVNINPLLTARELEHQLRDSGSTHIVVYADALPTLKEVLTRVALRGLVVAGRPKPGIALGGRIAEACAGPASALRDALALGGGLPCRPVELCGTDVLFLQYTEGTTGPSKGAVLTHRNLVANIEQFKAVMQEAMRPGAEVVVTASPLYHAFALTLNFLAYFTAGAENWLVTNPRDMDDMLAILRRARPTVLIGVNPLFARLTQHPDLSAVDWTRLRVAAGGGAAVVRTVSERWQAVTGTFIREGYGLSETSPVLSFNPAHISEFSGSSGLPVPSTDIVLLDGQDRPVPIGQCGEVCASGPQVMRGYWGQDQANTAAFTADGYFRTGDIGVFDQRGFLTVIGRKQDIIVVSGFKVYPHEVEEVAGACPGVAECACVGVPDAGTGAAVTLHVVPAAGAALHAQDVIAHCRAGLAACKVPVTVLFCTALPKSNAGKILRREPRCSA